MKLSLLTFFSSLLITFLLVRYQHLHGNLSTDTSSSGPQKFHLHIVTRIGGLGIYLALIISCFISLFTSPEKENILLNICMCAIPVFTIGFVEDLTKKISVKLRLLIAFCSALIFGYFFNGWITVTEIPIIDLILNFSLASIIFTTIAISGLVNAYNIIDGFNGLASMLAIISLLAISYVGFKSEDMGITYTSLICIGAILGFFVWNYPRGLIFLGDGGAYLLGFLVATLSILLIKRNPSISAWFAILVNAYPIFETLFTIWRRTIHQRKNPGQPDGIHLHSLVYRRLIRWGKFYELRGINTTLKNSKTSHYIWLLSTLATFPAIIWWQNTWVLQCFTLLFMISYIWIYRSIVKFKTPQALKLLG